MSESAFFTPVPALSLDVATWKWADGTHRARLEVHAFLHEPSERLFMCSTLVLPQEAEHAADATADGPFGNVWDYESHDMKTATTSEALITVACAALRLRRLYAQRLRQLLPNLEDFQTASSVGEYARE